MYLLAEIDKGGYIWANAAAGQFMVHKDTRWMFQRATCFDTFSAAKRMRALEEIRNDWCLPLILRLDEYGGADEIWVNKQDHADAVERLKTWAGCYGAWPVRVLKPAA